jgi:hypothetical protein
MVTGYEMKDRFSIPDKTRFLSFCIGNLSLALKWPRREIEHSPTSAEIKNTRNDYFHLLISSWHRDTCGTTAQGHVWYQSEFSDTSCGYP